MLMTSGVMAAIVSSVISWKVAVRQTAHELGMWRRQSALEQARSWLAEAASCLVEVERLRETLSSSSSAANSSRDDIAQDEGVSAVEQGAKHVAIRLRALAILAGSHPEVSEAANLLSTQLARVPEAWKQHAFDHWWYDKKEDECLRLPNWDRQHELHLRDRALERAKASREALDELHTAVFGKFVLDSESLLSRLEQTVREAQQVTIGR